MVCLIASLVCSDISVATSVVLVVELYEVRVTSRR